MKKKPKNTKNKNTNSRYDTRRPLENMQVPEGTNLGISPDVSRIEYNATRDMYVELFKAALSEGLDKREIKKLLNLNSDAFEKIEKQVINEDGQTEITKASPYRYYEYLQRQEKCIRDLEFFTNKIDEEILFYKQAQDEFMSGKLEKLPSGRPNINAGIMAIKAKSDILDKMIKTGQELGVVEKRAKELRVSGNLNLAALPTEELKALLMKKMGEMTSLSKREKLPPVYAKMLEAKVVSNNEES